jgi:hypothetical protein
MVKARCLLPLFDAFRTVEFFSLFLSLSLMAPAAA